MFQVIQAVDKYKQINPLFEGVVVNRELFTAANIFTEDPTAPQIQDVNPYIRHIEDRRPYCETTLVQMNSRQVNSGDVELYASQRIVAHAMTENEKQLDVMCFPHHFPKGRFGMADPKRLVSVQPADYWQARLRNKDPRFRRDSQWLFHAVNLKDIRAINAGMYTCMHLTTAARFSTARAVLAELPKGSESAIESHIKVMMGQLYGSSSYWNRVRGDAMAQERQFGPCHLFMTWNPAEWKWPELRAELIAMNPDLDIEKLEQGAASIIDPVTTAMHFNRRFSKGMGEIVAPSGEEGIFGEVEHYFWRLEFQARGAPHVHMKLWIKDAPIVGKNTVEEIIEWVNKRITCALPSAIKDPVVRKLVEDFQVHLQIF